MSEKPLRDSDLVPFLEVAQPAPEAKRWFPRMVHRAWLLEAAAAFAAGQEIPPAGPVAHEPIPAYSGQGSTAFWARVKALPEKAHRELYACGVLLQDMEKKVLTWLQDAERFGR